MNSIRRAIRNPDFFTAMRVARLCWIPVFTGMTNVDAGDGEDQHFPPRLSSSGLTGGPSILRPCAMSTGRSYYVYILSSRIGGTLYIGVTNDLVRRVYEHKTKAADGFTKKHGVDRLVYYEQFEDVEEAIRREKRLKRYNRSWKISMIDEENPHWVDLYPSIASF